MYESITPELIADLWERPLIEDAAIGYSITDKGYYVAPGRFLAEAHLVITQDELHGRTVTGATGNPTLWEELAKEIDAEEPVRCEVCGARSTMPMGYPCEDCTEMITEGKGSRFDPDYRDRVMDR